jgi:hypothetical protein
VRQQPRFTDLLPKRPAEVGAVLHRVEAEALHCSTMCLGKARHSCNAVCLRVCFCVCVCVCACVWQEIGNLPRNKFVQRILCLVCSCSERGFYSTAEMIR